MLFSVGLKDYPADLHQIFYVPTQCCAFMIKYIFYVYLMCVVRSAEYQFAYCVGGGVGGGVVLRNRLNFWQC